jgi:transitional endoplasmic reticulum ATPase
MSKKETLWIKGLCEECNIKMRSGNWSFDDLCKKCQEKATPVFGKLLSKYNELVNEYNMLVEEYERLSSENSELRELMKSLSEESLTLKQIARGYEEVYVELPGESITREGLITTDGMFYSYGMLSKKQKEEVKSGKIAGIAIAEGRVIGTWECEPLREEAQITGIKSDIEGNTWIRFRLSGNREFTKRYNPRTDKVPLDQLKVGYRINLMPGTWDIMEVYKPEKEPLFYFATKEDIERVLFEDVGGLWKEKERIRELIELALKKPEVFKYFGRELPRGILFYGPPGVGKTLLAKAIATEIDAYFIGISGGDIYTKWVGEPEERIGEIFAYAKRKAPAIIFIDEIDALVPKREEVSEIERRVVARLCKEMDGLEESGKVIVIAATNRPNAIDPALRRPGRFSYEIKFPIPDEKARYEILKIHTRKMRESGALSEDVDLEYLAKVTHGYSGADLQHLCQEASAKALHENITSLIKEGKDYKTIKVTMKHFEEALKEIKPSLLRELYVEIPEVRWSDVGGLEDVKSELRRYIELPLKNKDAADYLKIERKFGILLYGPPGCGKTLLAKAVAGECGINFIPVKGPELFSKWVGETEKGIREIFKRAREVAPCIICIDEIEALLPRKGSRFDSGASDNAVSQFLAELDGLEKTENIYVIGTSNRPDLIEPAVLRPGRIGLHLYLGPPDKKARLEIYKIYTRGIPLAEDVNLEELASLEGYTGAHIKQICEYAKLFLLEEFSQKGGDIREYKLSKRHFDKAIEKLGIEKVKELRDELEKMEEVYKRFHEEKTAYIM